MSQPRKCTGGDTGVQYCASLRAQRSEKSSRETLKVTRSTNSGSTQVAACDEAVRCGTCNVKETELNRVWEMLECGSVLQLEVENRPIGLF